MKSPDRFVTMYLDYGEIEAEQALVAANRELIACMEKKIQATLARVWGDEKPEENRLKVLRS